MRSKSALSVAVSISILGGSLAGCGSSEEASKQPAEVSAQAEEMITAFYGLSVDYDPAATPQKLAEQSELVVSGRISKFQPGRDEVVKGTGQLLQTTTVLMLEKAVVAAGTDKSKSKKGEVYIEMPPLPPGALERLSAAFPQGTKVVAYVQEGATAATNGQGDTEFRNVEAGRPTGEPLYGFVNPQGFVAQAEGDSTVVWPIGGGQAQQGAIDAALPSGNLIGTPG